MDLSIFYPRFSILDLAVSPPLRVPVLVRAGRCKTQKTRISGIKRAFRLCGQKRLPMPPAMMMV